MVLINIEIGSPNPIISLVTYKGFALIVHFLNKAESANVKSFNDKLSALDPTRQWQIRITEADERTIEQNAKMHAMLSDISKQAKHLNKVLEVDDWKRLTVDQFKTDCINNNVARLADYWRKNNFKLMPGLDGTSLVTLGKNTREFPRYVASGFVEWLLAYGADNNIKWSDPKLQFTDYEIERYGS